jgi:hypothetical protein
MAFERRAAFAIMLIAGAAMPVAAGGQTPPPPATVHAVIDTDMMVRNVNTPAPTDWRPDEAEQSLPLELFARYRDALANRQYAAAYAMGHPEFQGTQTVEAFAAAEAEARWARGRIALTRMSWYPAPAGQPHNLYVAFDLVSRLDSGDFVCGYVIFSRIAPTGADFRLLNQRITYVEPSLVVGGMPQADITPSLDCWLGEGVRTQLNRG